MRQVITADLDEIVFSHRNKAYGAYVLRQQYASNTLRGFLGSLLLVAAFVLVWVLSTAGTAQHYLEVVLPMPPRQDTVHIQAYELQQRLQGQHAPAGSAEVRN